MALPIIGDILNGIRSAIDWLVETIPKPVLFLFFIFFITLIGGAIIPIFMNLGGTFCIDNLKYENNRLDIFENVKFMAQTLKLDDEELLPGQIEVEDNPYTFNTCVIQTEGAGASLEYWYSGAYCTDCEEIEEGDAEYRSWNSGFIGNASNEGACKGDVYRIPDKDKTVGQRIFCESVDDPSLVGLLCEPPAGFYYNFTLHRYDCIESWCENTTMMQAQKVELKESLTLSPLESRQLIGIKCDGNKARFAVAGVDLFNYKMWLLIFILILIIWMAGFSNKTR